MLLSAFIAISGKSYPRIHVYTCYPMRGAPLTGGLRRFFATYTIIRLCIAHIPRVRLLGYCNSSKKEATLTEVPDRREKKVECKEDS